MLATARKYQPVTKDVLLAGNIYANLGQVYQAAAENLAHHKYIFYKNAADCYRYAQKCFNRHSYPYDFGMLSYRLSKVYCGYWKQSSDVQALRDAVFHLREAEKIFNPSEVTGEMKNYVERIAGGADPRRADPGDTAEASGGQGEYLSRVRKGQVFRFHIWSDVKSKASITLTAAGAYMLRDVGWYPLEMGEMQFNKVFSVKVMLWFWCVRSMPKSQRNFLFCRR